MTVIELPLLFKDQQFTPEKLKEIMKPIVVTLLNTASADIGKGGGYYDDENTEVTERRFLGSIKIPLKPLSSQVQNKGSFPLIGFYEDQYSFNGSFVNTVFPASRTFTTASIFDSMAKPPTINMFLVNISIISNYHISIGCVKFWIINCSTIQIFDVL